MSMKNATWTSSLRPFGGCPCSCSTVYMCPLNCCCTVCMRPLKRCCTVYTCPLKRCSTVCMRPLKRCNTVCMRRLNHCSTVCTRPLNRHKHRHGTAGITQPHNCCQTPRCTGKWQPQDTRPFCSMHEYIHTIQQCASSVRY